MGLLGNQRKIDKVSDCALQRIACDLTVLFDQGAGDGHRCLLL
jgi:hypothetical protein